MAAGRPRRVARPDRRRHDDRGRPLRRDRHRQRGGRRHPRPPPRPGRQAGPAARARATTCRGSATTGTPPRSSSRASTARRSSGTTSTATSSRRRSTTTSAGTRSSTARRCSGCGRRTSASCSHHDGISPAWPIDYADLEPYYTEAEHLYRVHGRHGEDPTEGPASADYRVPAGRSTSRASSSSSDDLEKQGLHPFHLPIGVDLTRTRTGMATRDSACIRCDRVDGFPCLVQAQVRRAGDLRRSRAGARQRRLVTRAYVERLETDHGGRAVTAVVTEIGDGARRRSRFSADVVVVAVRRGELRRAAAALGERPRTRTAWPTARTWSAATTCGTTTSP